MLRSLGHELSFAKRWRGYLFAVLLVAGNVTYGLAQVPNTAFLHHVALYGYMMNTPLTPILPVAAVLLGCLPMYAAIGHRFVANTRARMSVRRYVAVKLMGALVIPFGTFFLVAFVPFLISFYLWPTLGDPGLDPQVYGMNAAEAARAELTDSSYSNLIAIDPLFFGVFYSLWLGIGAAGYAGLGVAALVLLPNRNVAVVLPFLVYLVQTVLSGLVGDPHLGLLYSLMPFGLKQTSILAAAAPQLTLFFVIIAIWIRIGVRAPREPRLA